MTTEDAAPAVGVVRVAMTQSERKAGPRAAGTGPMKFKHLAVLLTHRKDTQFKETSSSLQNPRKLRKCSKGRRIIGGSDGVRKRQVQARGRIPAAHDYPGSGRTLGVLREWPDLLEKS